MKDFLLKHPFIAFLMLEEICATIRALATHKYDKTSIRVAETAVEGLEEIRNYADKAEKEVIGFKFVKEE